jgi:hypothetical protein
MTISSVSAGSLKLQSTKNLQRRVIHYCACIAAALLIPALLAGDAMAQDSPTLTARRIDSAITLDGHLNEPAWQTAIPATDFRQFEPNSGEPATQPTEVRILYDTDHLYVGVTCSYSEPGKIVAHELEYDGHFHDDDWFSVAFDTYNDKRSAFVFTVNANGARWDARMVSSLRNSQFDDDWNGIWDTRVHRTESAWTAEMVIPIKTLSFPRADVQAWGLNFHRYAIWKNEDIIWAGSGRNDGYMQLAAYGTLLGLEGLKRGNRTEVKPYVLSGIEHESNKYNGRLKYGLDVKYPLTSDLTLDLTTLTDFAQIEADRTIINLERFSYRYPEKRDFFLEGADIFSFASSSTAPFYSRRIGLTPSGVQVPILGGAKLTGKVGDYQMGVLNIQTEAEAGMPSTNYGVVRMKKDVFERSYIGMIATNLADETGHTDQVLAVDGRYQTNKFLGDKNFNIGGYLSKNFNHDVSHSTFAGRCFITMPNDQFNLFLLHHARDVNYDPEIGFVNRPGVRQYMGNLHITPRLNRKHIRKLLFMPISINYYTDMDNMWITRITSFSPFGFSTPSGANAGFSVFHSYENHTEDFKLFGDTIIPAGDYDWWHVNSAIRTNPKRAVSVHLHSQFGNYYSGTRTLMDADFDIKVNKHLQLGPVLTYNRLKLGADELETKEYGIRATTNFSTRLAARTFLQWNNQSELVNLNFRVHYIPRIGSDLYFVYNHQWKDSLTGYRTFYNTAVAKIDYQFTF